MATELKTSNETIVKTLAIYAICVLLYLSAVNLFVPPVNTAVAMVEIVSAAIIGLLLRNAEKLGYGTLAQCTVFITALPLLLFVAVAEKVGNPLIWISSYTIFAIYLLPFYRAVAFCLLFPAAMLTLIYYKEPNSAHSAFDLYSALRVLPSILTPIVIVFVIKIRKTTQLQKLHTEIDSARQESTIDHLTGIYNRRYIEQSLAALMQQQAVTAMPVTIMLADIDNFKAVNDSFGHAAGDKVICAVADTIQKNIRLTDICGRYGGEEFIIICPNTDTAQALTMANRIVQSTQLQTADLPREVTLSIGVATAMPDDTPDSLIAKADSALYTAKREGKNCVKLFEC